MSKLILTFSVILCAMCLKAQTDIYTQLKKTIGLSHPELVTDNKLIAFNTWSMSDQESRAANKSFEKAYAVYEYARLKGGLAGIVVVMINTDNLSGAAVITLHKDGIIKSVSLSAEEIAQLSQVKDKNVVFDSNGNEVYKNLSSSAVFSSIQQLITR